MYPETTQGVNFTLDTQGYFLDKTAFMIKGENLEFLNGVLASQLSLWYLKKICSTLGADGFSASKIFIEKLPIKKPTKKQEAKMIELVKEITKLKADIQNATSSDHATKINELAKEKIAQIDALVYKLYDLSEEEIQVIEKG